MASISEGFRKTIFTGLVIGGAIAMIFLIGALTMVLIAPSGFFGYARERAFGYFGYSGQPLSQEQDDAELALTIGDYQSISTWVLDCLGARSFDQLPLSTRRLFDPENDASSMDEPVREETPSPSKVRTPNVPERRILRLNRTVTRQRYQLGKRVAASYLTLQLIQWVTIVVGLLTTVLVSLASAELWKNGTKMSYAIRIAAIALPALGTAIAAINSFYTPREEFARASHTLASLAQLHQQVAFGLDDLACITSVDPNSDGWKLVDGWVKRYQDIQAISEVPSGSDAGSMSPETKGVAPPPKATTPAAS